MLNKLSLLSERSIEELEHALAQIEDHILDVEYDDNEYDKKITYWTEKKVIRQEYLISKLREKLETYEKK